MHQVVSFSALHTDGVCALTAAEGWPSWTPERAERALTAPGVVAVVAERVRGRGIGRELMLEAARRTGLERFDLLSADDALAFYERFPHKRKPGVRIYV